MAHVRLYVSVGKQDAATDDRLTTATDDRICPFIQLSHDHGYHVVQVPSGRHMPASSESRFMI
jgi:hypothetical protein